MATSVSDSLVTELQGQGYTGSLADMQRQLLADSQLLSYVSGKYYGPYGDRTGAAQVLNRLTVVPIFIHKPITIDRLAIECTILAASSVVRLGIYNFSKTTNRPTTLILDAGTVDTATTGVKEATVSQALARGWYGLAACAQGGTPTLRGTLGDYNQHFANETGAKYFGTQPGIAAFHSNVSGALPGTFVQADTSGDPPLVAFRVV